MAVSLAITDSTVDLSAVHALPADMPHGSMTRCIAPESLMRIGMLQPGIITRASQRGARPGDLRGHPARLAEASMARDQPHAVRLPQVVRMRRTAAVHLGPVAGRVPAQAAATRAPAQAAATALRIAAEASQVHRKDRAAIRVRALAAEEPAAAAGLHQAVAQDDRSAGAAARARLEAAAVAVAGDKSSTIACWQRNQDPPLPSGCTTPPPL
jgi:hypothetical protein